MLAFLDLARGVLLGIVANLDGEKKSYFGDNVLEVLQLASTLWPISFAAVLGPFLKTLALFKAERGATVGSLEFLLTGQTAVAAFKNLFMLHHKTNLTGDRNAFDMGSLSLTSIPQFRRVAMAALSGSDILVAHANRSSRGFEEAVARIGGRHQAARLGRQDIWHNVRIPFMEYLPGYDAENPTFWTSVPDDEVVPLSSFIGVPIRGGSLPRAGNSSMMLQSRYQILECGDGFNGTDWVLAEGNNSKIYFHWTSGNRSEWAAISRQSGVNHLLGAETSPSLWLDVLKTNESVAQFYDFHQMKPQSRLQLLVGGLCKHDQQSNYMGMRICHVSTSYVDVAVECSRLGHFGDLECRATKIRQSSHPTYSSKLSDLSLLQIAGSLCYEMPFLTATYNFRRPSLLEQYLRNPPTAFNMETDDISMNFGGCHTEVPRQSFEARLATALNTFLMASYNYTVLTGADGTSFFERNDMWQNITATWTEYTEEIYAINRAWFSTSVISTLILLTCTIANVVIRHITMAPDFLDSVDGLMRGSPFVKIGTDHSNAGSGTSSRDRIKVTKDIRVQIQDVQPEMEVGEIALTSDIRSSKLDWKRAYN
ncbi:hypothetical protein FLONG3_6300 [Fusarium longipes]|uniref:Uncharacterized protein n=1 Tax=Fusarium longipes TaxID=694270 RepID=A0A395SM73_9HYPO|nr:hypothetical protein FLONG3_6300 [Fusarium longipes]